MNPVQAIEMEKLNPRSDGEFLSKSNCNILEDLNKIFFITDFTIDLLDSKINLSKLNEEMNAFFGESPRIFTWQPSSEKICSSSIAKYFFDAGRNVNVCRNKLSERSAYGLKFPQIPPDCDEQSFAVLSEFIAMALLDCNIEPTEIPDECIDIGRGKVVHAKGLIGEISIRSLIDEVRKILRERPSFPWIAISLFPSYSRRLESRLLVITKTSIIQFTCDT